VAEAAVLPIKLAIAFDLSQVCPVVEFGEGSTEGVELRGISNEVGYILGGKGVDRDI
jgi:hypothetical protein